MSELREPADVYSNSLIIPVRKSGLRDGRVITQGSHSLPVSEPRLERGCLDSKQMALFTLSIHNAGNQYLEKVGTPKCVNTFGGVEGGQVIRSLLVLPCFIQELYQIVAGKPSICLPIGHSCI